MANLDFILKKELKINVFLASKILINQSISKSLYTIPCVNIISLMKKINKLYVYWIMPGKGKGGKGGFGKEGAK